MGRGCYKQTILLLLLSSLSGFVTPSHADRRALLEPSLGPSNAAEPSMGVPPVPEPSSPPLASLGPRPGGMDLSLLVTLDVWGPGLLTFDIRQQETLLQVMNETILDAYSDELQLLRVEDILPLTGPSSVSLYTSRNQSLDSPPTPMRKLLEGRRKLLQNPPGRPVGPPLATAGDSTNISSLPHLQLMVRVSVAPGQTELLKEETKSAVTGPMLPMLRERGMNVQYMTLSAMTVDYGDGGPDSRPPRSDLSPGVIAGIAIAAFFATLGLVVALLLVRWRRRRQHSQAVLHKNQPSSSGSETSVEMVFRPQDGSSGYGQQMFLPTSRSLSPPDSLAGSSESRRNNKISKSKAMDPELCTVPFDELQFSRVIGEGSFGRVFLGKWQETTVAIKILLSSGGPLPDDSWDVQDLSQLRDCSWSHKQQSQSPAQKLIVDELAREAGLMAKLRHPNIVMFLGAVLDPPCMVTEFCARGSLLDVLHRARTNEVVKKELDWRRRLRLALDAAKGMNYLHTRQPPILHRDLKSANLLVDKHWQAKVADFNLSRVMQPSAAMSSLAATNPRWLPPEVLSGESHGASTDVYAYGIVLWELLSWDIPWKEESPWQVVIAVVDHDKRPEIPGREEAIGGYPVAWQEFLNLLESCWCKDPAMRPTFDTIITSMRFLIDAEDAEADMKVESTQVPVASASALGARQQQSGSPSQPYRSPFTEMPSLPNLAFPGQ